MAPMLATQIAVAEPVLPFWVFFVATVVKMVVVFTVYMIGVALLTLAERKISAWIQGRLGPAAAGR